MKSASIMLACTHLYNVVRIVQRIYVRYNNVKEKASVLKCFLVDCYACVAVCCFISSQLIFYTWKDYCYLAMKQIDWWFQIEIYY